MFDQDYLPTETDYHDKPYLNFEQSFLLQNQYTNWKNVDEKGCGLSSSQSSENLEAEPTIVSEENVKEVLFNGFYYNVTDWIQRHPGGDIIEFYTEKGEDATLAIQQFHNRSIRKVGGVLKSLKRRPATKEIVQVNFDIQKRHEALTKDFTELFQNVESEGLLKPSLVHVALRILECIFWGMMGMLLTQSNNFVVYSLGIVCLILLSARTAWLQHEGGHHALTGWPILDKFIQAGAFGIGSGLSSSWYSHHHYRHHAMPQRFEKDADLETLPLLAFNKKVAEALPEKGGFFIQHQAALFIGVDTFLIGLYWKFYLHPMHTIKNKRYDELIFMSIHYVFAYFVGIWSTLVITFFSSILLMGNISLSHLHFPLATERLHWVEYALLHTTDITSSRFTDWWMGYLNFQIEHHLFPTMPQYKNHLVSARVKALAAKYELPYHVCSYKQAVINCIKNLHHVAKELKHDSK